MPIDSTKAKAIAAGFAKGETVSFSTPYMGLFVKMPDVNGANGEETSYPEYARVKLTAIGIEGKTIMGTATTAEGEGDDAGKLVATIKNQEIIYFPEAETGAGGTVVGYGLFSAPTGGTPYQWGELKTPMPINQNSVPMFRIDNFKLMVK